MASYGRLFYTQAYRLRDGYAQVGSEIDPDKEY